MQTATDLLASQLRMRAPAASDKTFILGLLVDSDVRRYLGGPVSMADLQPTLQRYLAAAQAHPTWIAENQGRPCGLISLTPHKDGEAVELSYQFMPRAWGRGMGSAACKYALGQAFGPLALPKVIAETQAANAASIALLQRICMVEARRVSRFGAEQVIFAIMR